MKKMKKMKNQFKIITTVLITMFLFSNIIFVEGIRFQDDNANSKGLSENQTLIAPEPSGDLSVIVSPGSASKIYGSTQTFSFSLSDMLEGYSGEWWIAIDGGAWASQGAWTLIWENGMGTYYDVTYYTTASGLSVGNHVVHARFYSSGNADEYKDATITINPLPEYHLSWNSPSASSDYIFGPGEGALPFDFSYTQNDHDDVKLFLNGIDVGSVWNMNSIDLTYNGGYDGTVTAVLKGYDGGVEKSTASRNFNFIWVHFSEMETLEENYTIMPSKLYTIIHDPSGDGSTSTYEESHSFELGVGVSLAVAMEKSISISAGPELFGEGLSASGEVSLNVETGGGYDFEYKMTTSSSITSSMINDNSSYIGPGYGDIYWGEGWIMQWRVYALHVEYHNGTHEYLDRQFDYGINRSSEMILNNNYAPDEWKDLNPALNNYNGVTFDDDPKSISGGNSQTFSQTVSTTNTLTEYLEIKFSETTEVKFGILVASGEASMTLSVEANVHGSQEHSDEIKTSYTITDDDPGDLIIQEIGIDPLFGTPIFRLIEDSLTSNPLEHGSTDYLPPEIGDHTINYDSDGNSPSPSEGDSPLVHVHITDEDRIANAWVYYSTDNITFDRVDLVELPGLDDEWEANIPAQEHDSTVYWYIRAGDLTDHYSIKKNEYNDCFTYNVLNRDPTVDLITPNDGGTFSGDLLISWSGIDPDMDDLTYSLGYSFDGVIWNPIITGLDINSYLWDISGFGDQPSVVIRVIASDDYNGEGMDVSDYGFTIDNPDAPEIDYLAPLGGFTYSGIQTIEWDIFDIDNFVTSIDLEYSVNSGLDWNEIVSGLDASVREFDWNTSDVIFSEEVKIRVIANYEVESVSHYVFDISGIMTIDNRPNLGIDIISPNGGELFENEVMISWSVDTIEGVDYEVMIDYTTDGNIFTNIATGITENSYLWNTEDIPFGTNYRIRVSITGEYMNYELDPFFDISEVAFTIDPSSGIDDPNLSITLLSPNGGEIINGLHNITWETVNPQNENLEYHIYYSLNNGENWTLITSDTVGNFYIWDTSAIEDLSTQCLIKIEAVSIETQEILDSDISDDTFTIGDSLGGIPGYNLLSLGLIGFFSIAVSVKLISKKLRK